ncbi:MAG: lamin tail domain-containing protein, partial [Clostridia bacterium]|nr:lamin tail domain-containing protein [Clostridia bacterium]
MKMKKKAAGFLALFLALVSLFTYTACNRGNNQPDKPIELVTTNPFTTPDITTGGNPPVNPPQVGDGHPKEGDIVISEVMVSNNSTNKDFFGEYSDWIEIYNASESKLSLDKCYLSDNPDKPAKFELPDVIMEPGQYLLVYASDKEVVAENGELHAKFKLSAGETVCLTYKDLTVS